MIELRWVRPDKTTTKPDRLQWREVDYLPEESYPTEIELRGWTDVPLVVLPSPPKDQP